MFWAGWGSRCNRSTPPACSSAFPTYAPTSAVRAEVALRRVIPAAGQFVPRSLVITAGHGTNDVLALLPGCTLQIPITKDRPSDAKYYTPPADVRHLFTSDVMPVIAYLD